MMLREMGAPTISMNRHLGASFLRRLTTITLTAALAIAQPCAAAVFNGTDQSVALHEAAVDGLPIPFIDDFSHDSMSGWVVVDQTSQESDWAVVDSRLHQNWRIESEQGLEQTFRLGSYAFLDGGSGLTDYRFRVEATYLAPTLAEDIGVMFRYRDPENFYRLSVNSRNGFTRLEKRVNGVFSALATDARGYVRGETLDIEVEVRGPHILIWRNTDPLFAVADASHGVGTVALYTQDQAQFDNVRIDAPSSTPSVVLSTPLAYLTNADTSLQATALALNEPEGAYVEFRLNDGEAQIRSTAPYQIELSSLAPGNHQLSAILRNASGTELSRDTNTLIGVGGHYMVGIGDSIANGVGDNYSADNLSRLGRLIGFQGYHAILTDLLDDRASTPSNLVFNEGVGGDATFDAAFKRLESIRARHPAMDTALILIGTNDAIQSIPSGLGCVGADCNGTFKGNLQTLVDKLRLPIAPGGDRHRDINTVIALPAPIFRSRNPWKLAANDRLREYISVINNEISGISLGPDLFGFFMQSARSDYRSLYSDPLHPNGLGYRVMAVLWYNALNPSSPVELPFVLDDLKLSYSDSRIADTETWRRIKRRMSNLSERFWVAPGESDQSRLSGHAISQDRAPTHERKFPQQNLLEPGNTYYNDADFTVTSIPPELADGRWIMTSNADRNSTKRTYVSFSVDRDVDVFVGYDVGAMRLPGWLGGFEETGLSVSTTNPSASSLKLFRKSYAPGSISLGGNLSGSAAGANANYVVVVVEK
jgi:lysophospholipase L1-like esterase